MASSPEDVETSPRPEEDDLFGSDDEAPTRIVRELSDRDLDSGDDEDREDRVHRDDVEDADERDARILETKIFRHPVPKPVDGEFNILRLPGFVGIEPRAYDPNTFEPPTTEHHRMPKTSAFSANATATSTIRFRKDPSTGSHESNTVVYKWSDGTTTIAVGDQHYELQTKPLAPPKESKVYQDVQDSHSYLASPSMTTMLLLTVGHLTNQYTIRPNKHIVDDALEKLQQSLAAATRRGNKGDEKSGPELITNTIDPELQKKKAETAEKERMKAQRRRETAAEKANLPRGVGGGRGGLNADDLEGRGRRGPGIVKPRAKAPKRRADYDSDDDDLPRGRHREDEYDKEDDFLASSDEEEPEAEDDDEDEMMDDESDRGQPKAKKQKVSRRGDNSDDDADAEADLDDEDVPAPQVASEPAGRGRKRNIIEDDDE